MTAWSLGLDPFVAMAGTVGVVAVSWWLLRRRGLSAVRSAVIVGGGLVIAVVALVTYGLSRMCIC
jgi:hypothetical protein